jgi:formylglycine-generating enzyme required for sulfatase activity
MKKTLRLCVLSILSLSLPAWAGTEALIPSGSYVPFFSARKKAVSLRAFFLDVYPVTESRFLEFVRARPEWKRSKVKRIFADENYLSDWKSDFGIPEKSAPVTFVSWFAASAYCHWRGARLPTTDEWEFVARADETKRNALRDPGFKKRLLEWYGKPAAGSLKKVGSTFRNVYGVFDMHGLIWEWVADFNSTFLSDGRNAGEKLPKNLFCAGGAVGAADPSDYAAFMRLAFRSSLQGDYTVKTLGFRCARSLK